MITKDALAPLYNEVVDNGKIVKSIKLGKAYYKSSVKYKDGSYTFKYKYKYKNGTSKKAETLTSEYLPGGYSTSYTFYKK